MKNFTFKNITIVIFSLFSMSLFAQENSISPIFALSAHSGSTENTFVSINQKTGNNIDIESFSSESYLNKNFTISTIESSNVDKVYFLNNNNNLSVYDVPYFFDQNYQGVKNEITVSNHISDLDFHHQSSLIYAFDLNTNNLFSLSPSSGNVQATINIPFNTSIADFAIKTTNDYVILSGKENDSINIVFFDIVQQTSSLLKIKNTYEKFTIVANSNLSDLYAIAKNKSNKNLLLKISPSTEIVETVANLPSCSNCATEEYLYKKNGLAIDWENNELLAIVNQKINTTDHYFLFTFDLANGETNEFASLAKETSNLYFNKASADLVFPGDANHDGIVNLKDMFPIGLKYSFNTTARFTQNSLWIGQHSFNTGTVIQGVDVKHADCNGDGQINITDRDVIIDNYSYIHNSNKTSATATLDCDYPLSFSYTTTAYEDNEARINVKLGTTSAPVSNVYGVNFTISYNKNFVVPNSMTSEGLNSWFGTEGSTYIHSFVDDYANGKIEINLIGTDLLNRSGGGDIITAIWVMGDLIIPSIGSTEEMNLKIEDITIINLAETVLESCGEDTSITVYHKDAVSITTVNNNLIEIFPNPAHSFIQIVSDEKINKIEMISISGKIILTQNLTYTNKIDVSQMSRGVYYLKLYTKEGSYLDKILID